MSVSGVNELPDVTYKVHYLDPITGDRAPAQCSNGLYLGPNDEPYIDCDSVCKSDTPGQFAYRFFDTNSYLTQYIYAAQPGSYCVPSRLNSYNPTTTTVVRGVYDWVFLPKWPSVFGGENGTRVETCRGSCLYDALTSTVYKSGYIPVNLNVSDPFNETVEFTLSEMIYITQLAYSHHLTSNKSDFLRGYRHPRFVCTDELVDARTGAKITQIVETPEPSQLDDSYNRFISAPEITRFTRIQNECAKNIPHAHWSILPDFENGTCDCLRGMHGMMTLNTDNNLDDERRNYAHIYEKGRLKSNEVLGAEANPPTYQQFHGSCSACPFGFVSVQQQSNIALELNAPTAIVAKPLMHTDFSNEYSVNLLNLPVSCVSPLTPVNKNTFKQNWLNVRMSKLNDRLCIDMVLDISLGLSKDAKKIVNKFVKT
ncbi:hypothetical protein WDU94_012446 [Cyamophila willieti]